MQLPRWIVVPYDKPMPKIVPRPEVQGKCKRKWKEEENAQETGAIYQVATKDSEERTVVALIICRWKMLRERHARTYYIYQEKI